MRAREPGLLAERPRALGQGRDGLVAVLARGHDRAIAGRGRERDREDQLRVVGDPHPLGDVRPAPVEDELPLAVSLHVGGGDGDQVAAAVECEVAGQPAGLRSDAPCLFEAVEPGPLRKGGGRRERERVPRLAWNIAHALEQPDAQHWAAPPRAAARDTCGAWGASRKRLANAALRAPLAISLPRAPGPRGRERTRRPSIRRTRACRPLCNGARVRSTRSSRGRA